MPTTLTSRPIGAERFGAAGQDLRRGPEGYQDLVRDLPAKFPALNPGEPLRLAARRS